MRKVFFFLVFLIGLAGAGYWNYQRNLAKEEAAKGPYSGYSTEQLQDLAAAYEAEIEAAGGRYAAEKANRHQAGDHAYADQQMAEFEKAAQRGRAVRDAGGALSVREATLRDIQAELATRRPGTDREIFLRRLLTF
jgi:hypothetical protein